MIAEELENRSRVLGAPPRPAKCACAHAVSCAHIAGIEMAIQSLNALGLNSVNALAISFAMAAKATYASHAMLVTAQHLVQYQFRSKGTGAPNWKKASTLRPEAFPTLHALACKSWASARSAQESHV